ncbi:hypothetical protein PanWU01x14_362210 [Parasponia andersonii]|uniref:Uncharacterized protein n=1 Tax=Parasponia andersonii TaxID=3476 RepID=A0A2P5A704_PARAD|nr:hypothetical protein PanWU01x14_362210 [Parasponia andersonii]
MPDTPAHPDWRATDEPAPGTVTVNCHFLSKFGAPEVTATESKNHRRFFLRHPINSLSPPFNSS